MAGGPLLEPSSLEAPVRSLRGTLRALLLHDVWRNLALFLGFVQVQILVWAGAVFGFASLDAVDLLLLTSVAMLANALLVPLIRRTRSGQGLARRAGRLYMNLGIGTLLVGLAVLASWLLLYPLCHGLLALLIGGELGALGFRVTSGALVLSVAGAWAWGVSIGQAGYRASHTRIGVAGLDPTLSGLRILQITDLHIGNGLEEGRLRGLVEAVNRQGADLVVITGDIFDHDPAYIEDGARQLAGLRARLGVYAVLGNHDVYAGAEQVAAGLADQAPHIRLLRGDILPLETGAKTPLYIAGFDDPGRDWTARDLRVRDLERLARALPDDGPTLLLAHRPEVIHQASRLGFPVVLAGHTHGGQLALPFTRGQVNPSRILSPYTRGLYRVGETTLYVSRGVGMAGPRIRFACSRELALIELS